MLRALNEGLSAEDIAEDIFATCLPHTWLAHESCDVLIAALAPRRTSQIVCAYSMAARPAWNLSRDHQVHLEVEEQGLGAIIAMLASATRRSLVVRTSSLDAVSRDGVFRLYDLALILPPLGRRLKSGLLAKDVPGLRADDDIGSEALGALLGAQIGRQRSIVVVAKGFLFRTSSRDAAIKQELVQSLGLRAVISLPRGTMASTAVAFSALVFSPNGQDNKAGKHIRFIDASNPATLKSAEIPTLLDSKVKHPLSTDATPAQLSDAGFNLSVDRYVLSAETRDSRNLIGQHYTLTLSDLAEIRKPQALPRDDRQHAHIEIREALLADIDGGRLQMPRKRSQLPRSASTKIENAVLKQNDILLSIKGTIGKTALVTDEVIADSEPALVVAGQSFVILRLRKGSAITDARVLTTYLRTPTAQALLGSMAGGTTIPNVIMGDLKALPVPIPSVETQRELLAKFDERDHLLHDADQLISKSQAVEQSMFDLILAGEDQ